MSTMNRGGRAWQVLTVAVIAVPWLLRDELAVRLDARTSAAAEVQSALHQESERAVQAVEQRETRDRLHNIEILVKLVAKDKSQTETDDAKAELAADSVRLEAEELERSAQTFIGLLSNTKITGQPVAEEHKEARVALDQWLGIQSSLTFGLTEKQLKDLAEKVKKTARDVAVLEKPSDGKFIEWDLATVALDAAYEELRASAEKEQETTGLWASVARWAAWLFTALGVLMIGDWSRTSRGPDTDIDPNAMGDERAV